MKRLILSFVSFFSSIVFAQKSIENLSSIKLNEDRQITIGLPKSYNFNTDKKYPLLLLLDGDYLFDPFYGIVTYANDWDDIPEMIIVGITQNKNGKRNEDSFFNDDSGLPDKTGADFYDFIGTELLPYLEKKYRIASFKTIAGHDTTAKFLNSFLYKDKPLFNAYIVLSPDLALDMDKRIPIRLSAIQEQLFYYLATANDDLKKFQRNSIQLNQEIKKIEKSALNYRFSEFKGTHYSLVPQAIPDALYYIFDSYKPISIKEYQEKIVTLKEGYVNYLSQKYDLIKKELKMKVPIRLNDFKAIEAAITKNKAHAEFKKLATLAQKNYPKTMLSDYYTALFYENEGNKEKAIKTYINAFLKEEIGNLTKEMMYNKVKDLENIDIPDEMVETEND